MANNLNAASDLQYWNAIVRHRFVRLSMREKALSILFVGALLGVWFTFQMDRHGAARQEIRSANELAKQQGQWFAEQPEIDARYQTMIENINLSELPSVEAVNASIGDLISKYGFVDYKVNTPRTNPGIPLTLHTFTIDINKADYIKLVDFTNEIKSSLSYVSLRQMKIQADRRNPQFLSVKLELKSIEYTP